MAKCKYYGALWVFKISDRQLARHAKANVLANAALTCAALQRLSDCHNE